LSKYRAPKARVRKQKYIVVAEDKKVWVGLKCNFCEEVAALGPSKMKRFSGHVQRLGRGIRNDGPGPPVQLEKLDAFVGKNVPFHSGQPGVRVFRLFPEYYAHRFLSKRSSSQGKRRARQVRVNQRSRRQLAKPLFRARFRFPMKKMTERRREPLAS